MKRLRIRLPLRVQTDCINECYGAGCEWCWAAADIT